MRVSNDRMGETDNFVEKESMDSSLEGPNNSVSDYNRGLTRSVSSITRRVCLVLVASDTAKLGTS